jgi:hypothetical protein
MRLLYATYADLCAVKEDFSKLTEVEYGKSLNCKRVVAQLVKILLRSVYSSRQIDKAVFKYLAESVTKEVSEIIRANPAYNYKLLPFTPSNNLFIEVASALHRSLGT